MHDSLSHITLHSLFLLSDLLSPIHNPECQDPSLLPIITKLTPTAPSSPNSLAEVAVEGVPSRKPRTDYFGTETEWRTQMELEMEREKVSERKRDRLLQEYLRGSRAL